MAALDGVLPALIGAAGAGGGRELSVERSLRFNSGDTAYLNRTPSSSGDVDKWTWAGWVKRSNLGDHTDFFSAVQGFNDATIIQFDNNDKLDFENFVGGSNQGRLITEQVFRDVGAWYHITCIYDSGNSTADDRIKLFVNGSRVTSFSSSTNPSSGQNSIVNSTNPHYVGADKGFNNHYFNGYLSDVYLIDGSAVEPVDNFIELDDNGVYQPKVYDGAFGTNGFHLTFSDATSTTTIAEDSSGKNNDFTANNISVSPGAGNDSLFDVPLNGDTSSESGAGGEVSANYCTLNPQHVGLSGNATATNGNLVWGGTDNNHHVITGTFAISSGKWYWEATYTNASSNYVAIGLCTASHTITNVVPGYNENTAFSMLSSSGRYYYNSTSTTAYGSSWTTGDVIGVRYDDGDVYFYKNGSIMNASPILTLTGLWSPLFHTYDTGQWTVNFGQRSFAYSAPTNHKPLCSSLLDTPTIPDGSDYFEAKTYTGNGSTQTISLPHSPDLVWVKGINSAYDHELTTTVQPANKALASNIIDQEFSTVIEPGTNSFFLDGNSLYANESGINYVSWNWNTGTSTVSNSDGSLNSDVRVNQTAGSSVLLYTAGSGSSNETVGHGLNAIPELIFVKRRSGSDPYCVYHESLSTGEYLELNSTSGIQTSASVFPTSQTSSVFGIGTDGRVNAGSNTYIAYCFAPVAGYSAFGTYIGNGASGYPNANGPFVYTGMRPRFVLIKALSGSERWTIYDTARSTFNVADDQLYPDTSAGQASGSNREIDVLSNGFKIRSNGGFVNSNNVTYLYAAFAENPFQANGALAR